MIGSWVVDSAAFAGFQRNEYGTLVSEHICCTCFHVFTLCPPFIGDFGGCLSPECGTYDESRDIDKVWDAVQPFISEEARDA